MYYIIPSLFIYLFVAILTIENLVEVKQVLKDGSFQTIKWFDLGLYLGLSYNDLKTIEHNYPRDAEQCLTECLANWLMEDTEATRNKLSIATGKAIGKREEFDGTKGVPV